MKVPKLNSLKLSNIKIRDKLWSRYTGLVAEVIIPYQWDILNDRVEGAQISRCLRNFKIAAGMEQGAFNGVIFQDTDVYKWLEAVAFSLETKPDAHLEALADEAVALIARAQQSDGYLNTYFTIAKPDGRWSNLIEGHELYSAGHLIEAAVAYHAATGKDTLLNVACRFADLICKVFGKAEGQLRGYSGHQEVELALVKLYYATGERKYLETAKYFIDERGSVPSYFVEEIKKRNEAGGFPEFIPEFADYDLKYSQAHMPPVQQRTAEGHAVRAVYMYCAMADLAYEFSDAALLEACEALWSSIANKRMYITGSIGSSGFLERFTTDYDLPNDTNYSETCASIGFALFSLRMAAITRDARYIDIAEKTLYNTVLAGISLEGDRYFYVNPLEVWPDSCMEHTSKAHVKPVRQSWFSVACCPTNVARTLASLGQYIYLKDASALYLNLYIENEAEAQLGGACVALALKTSFLADGKSELTLRANEPCAFALKLRVPGYAESYTFTLNAKPVKPTIEDGYAIFGGPWEGSNTIEIAFDIRPKFVAANPGVRADVGKVALMKGPLVYCLEETDNGKNLASLFADPDTPVRECGDDALPEGLSALAYEGKRLCASGFEGGALYGDARFELEPVALKAVPYAVWGNRGAGEMLVWQKALIR